MLCSSTVHNLPSSGVSGTYSIHDKFNLYCHRSLSARLLNLLPCIKSILSTLISKAKANTVSRIEAQRDEAASGGSDCLGFASDCCSLLLKHCDIELVWKPWMTECWRQMWLLALYHLKRIISSVTITAAGTLTLNILLKLESSVGMLLRWPYAESEATMCAADRHWGDKKKVSNSSDILLFLCPSCGRNSRQDCD